MKILSAGLFFLALASQAPLYAASRTSAAAFLKIPASADAIALGGNAVAMGLGAGAAAANPATLGFLKQHELQTSYGSHMQGYSFFNAAYGHRAGPLNAGLSITRLGADDFEGRDAAGAPTGGFAASDLAVALSAARTVRSMSLGLSAKYISSAIDNESASALAVDAGLVYAGGRRSAYPYKAGIAIKNLGTGMKYISRSDPLPLTVAAALSVTVGGALDIGVNAGNNLTERAFEFGFGMGINLGESLFLTGGLSREMGAAAETGAVPFRLNAGAGFRVSNFMLNYGFAPMGELGSMQRLSVTLKFGARPGAGEFEKKSYKPAANDNSGW